MRSAVLLFVLLSSFTFDAVAQAQSKSRGHVAEYFPPPDSAGGWRTLSDPKEIRKTVGMDVAALDEAFDFVRTTTTNGGLLVVRHGYLVYEKYFGKGQREATPNAGSCGKSFTSVAVGILMKERPDLFPQGLDQKVFTPTYMPAVAFPLADARMKEIKLGQLLAFTAGIRGNNPAYVDRKEVTIDPAGPDGWQAMVDEYVFGIEDGLIKQTDSFSTKTLWCEPGGGYSYASASIHMASLMLNHITGEELEEFIDSRIAQPLGWGRWGFGYKDVSRVEHTPGAGGIALRSTDMLRFCYMLLHDGRWGKKQVVPRDFLEHASKVSPYNPHYPYSLQFHVNSKGDFKTLPMDAYWKTGSGGHCLYIIPSLDMVVWKLGGRDGQYRTSNTGLPEPKPLPDALPALGRNEKTDRENDVAALEMVLRSIQK